MPSTDGPARWRNNKTAGGFLDLLAAFVVLRENIQGENEIFWVNLVTNVCYLQQFQCNIIKEIVKFLAGGKGLPRK